MPRAMAEALREMAGWRAAGKLKSREDVVAGLETFPETLLKLFTGENFGKLVIKVADDKDCGEPKLSRHPARRESASRTPRSRGRR